MKRYLFFIICIGLLFSSCGTKSEKEIEEETSSGVVLVQNNSFYEVVLSNGESIYFTGFDEDGDVNGLEFDRDSVKTQISYGTGFFVSDDGQIATNAHVVSNIVADKDVNKSVAHVIDALKQIARALYDETKEELEEIEDLYNYACFSPDVSYEEFYIVKAQKESVEEKLNNIVEFYNTVDDIRPSDSEIKYHNEVSVAYNNTHVTDSKDFISCVVLKTDPDHDLAIIQLKDKKIPEDRYVFTIPDEDPLETYSFTENITSKISDDKNSKLLMSSFNLGPTLALTKEGVKSQFNTGSVSQQTPDRIMYSIPTLPGSSGSPVINLKEELVAINYAGLNGTQNFNYGIRVKHLRNLMEK